ncbi:hypothetical protein HC762_00085 [bacterium]|nr:hypothetical protein [bacterium]
MYFTEGADEPGKKLRVVPTGCWNVVVEVKEGLGVIWSDGKTTKELPEHLKKIGWPHRKEKQRKKNGGGDDRRRNGTTGGDGQKSKPKTGRKPRVKVETDEHDGG